MNLRKDVKTLLNAEHCKLKGWHERNGGFYRKAKNKEFYLYFLPCTVDKAEQKPYVEIGFFSKVPFKDSAKLKKRKQVLKNGKCFQSWIQS